VALLEARGITKVYPSGEGKITALEHVDLDFQAGETIAIVGPSGSGKSTLLNLLAGFDRPTAGSIRHEGNLITEMPEPKLATYRLRNFGFIFQSYNLIPILTASENVELPLTLAGVSRSERARTAGDLLKRVGLGKRSTHRPSQLSGGEQQRVAIARALATNASVLFADEPTGNLDTVTGHEILDLLLGPTAGGGTRTVVLITHDPEVAERATRVIRIRDGAVQAA
jgi:putative ABC transport system ATP-binding protein